MTAAAGLWIAFFASTAVAARTYPDRPVRVVIASGPGGSTDGVSRIVGDKLGEFWGQRWHISLSRWFRDYLFVPLGGSRVAAWRRMLNLMIVFTVSGLWHGANWTFVIWGALNGALQVLHVAFARPRTWLNRALRIPDWLAAILGVLLTFHLILITWIFFRAASLADALKVVTRVWQALPQVGTLLSAYAWSDELLLSFGLIAVLMIVEILDERRPVWNRLAVAPTVLRWGVAHGLLVLVLVIGRWGGAQFVYMQF